jgi:hypothetical protein
MDLVKDSVGPSSAERLARAIDAATAQYASEGITSFTDAGIGCPGLDHSPVEMAAYQRARTTGRLVRACHDEQTRIVSQLGLSAGDRHLIFAGNAARLLGLDA